MPTCAAPGCLNRSETHPDLSFHRLPWSDKGRIKSWLCKLNLKHNPAKNARICHEHFESKYVFLPARYTIAPHLYGKPTYELTDDAIPTLFTHKKTASTRTASLNREKTKQHIEAVKEILLSFDAHADAHDAASTIDMEPAEDPPLLEPSPSTFTEPDRSADFPSGPSEDRTESCHCMCRNCHSPRTRSIATQTLKNRVHRGTLVRPATKSASSSANMSVQTATKSVDVRPLLTEMAVGPDQPLYVESENDQLSPCPDMMDDVQYESDEFSDLDASDNTVNDPDYEVPSTTPKRRPARQNNTSVSPEDDTKFVIYSAQLKELFKFCPQCGSTITSVKFVSERLGSLLHVDYQCTSGCIAAWNSQPYINAMAAGNLMISAAILLTGSTYERFAEFAQVLNLKIMSASTFFEVQGNTLFPAINAEYTMQKEALIAAYGSNPLVLAGDARCDSPGYSAKYSTYSLMEVNNGAILTFQLNQVVPGLSSVALETKGCREVITELEDYDKKIDVVCTDCNASVGCMIASTFPKIDHQHDLYHIEKRIRKKLTAKAKTVKNADLVPWIKPVTNHLWWCAQNCEEDSVMLLERWKSCMHHSTNTHSWNMFEVYHSCAHEPLTNEEQLKKKWLIAGSPPHEALKEVITNKRLLKDISKTTRSVHTGPLECFHSLINKYAPKRQHFGFKGMLARTQLAVLDHNSNLNREQALHKDGKPKFNFCFPKRSMEWLSKPIFVSKSRHWRAVLMRSVVAAKVAKSQDKDYIDLSHLPKNIAKKPMPPKPQLIEKHVSRFQKP